SISRLFRQLAPERWRAIVGRLNYRFQSAKIVVCEYAQFSGRKAKTRSSQFDFPCSTRSPTAVDTSKSTPCFAIPLKTARWCCGSAVKFARPAKGPSVLKSASEKTPETAI